LTSFPKCRDVRAQKIITDLDHILITHWGIEKDSQGSIGIEIVGVSAHMVDDITMGNEIGAQCSKLAFS